MDKSDSGLLEPLLYNANNNTEERNVTEVVEKVNPKNAKRIAFILVIVLVLYHSYIHLRYGKFTFYLGSSFSRILTSIAVFKQVKILVDGCCQMVVTKVIWDGSLTVA